MIISQYLEMARSKYEKILIILLLTEKDRSRIMVVICQ
jgi:hypothetical protein